MVTAPVWSPRASKRTQFGESIRSSSVSSMATIRSSAGMSSMSALRSVVLPLPVPPLTRMLRRVWRVRSAACADVFGERALFDQLRRRKGSRAEAPDGDRHVRTGRRDTDRHARPVP